MDIDQATNARYGRIVLSIYTVLNGLMLIGASVAMWVLNARAEHRDISPNTSIGFRTQHTMASLRGWYAAQRAGFHFAAIATTVITLAVLALMAVALVRRHTWWWVLLVPVLGGVAVGVSTVLAGERAEHAATAVETPTASTSVLRNVAVQHISLSLAPARRAASGR